MKITLNEINEAVRRDPAALIEASDRAYHDSIAAAARHIADDDDLKIVAVAGPSGSGKTTTAHILQEMLEALDESTAVVSLDHFYLPRERLPIFSDGSPDFESVNALDAELIRKRFSNYLESGVFELPRYDFATGTRSESNKTIPLGERGIVIMEGLHALNPLITDLVPRKNIYKVYISPNQKIIDETGKVILDGRRERLVRRVLRDEIFRDADVNETLSLWENVIRGEEKFLYCFKDTADVKLKTFHRYEPGVFRNRFLETAKKLLPDAPCREFFMETVAAMERFAPVDPLLIPNNALICEFIGNGKYQL